MSESSELSAGGGEGGFALQGSSSSFTQRQAAIFGDLQILEAAHRKVEEETTPERLYVQQFWRETKPAVESLEAEKEARDRKAKKERAGAIATATFRIPAAPSAVPLHRRRVATARRLTDPHKDSSKWTYYSLADVNEDAASNREVAARLMVDLRRRRELAGEEEGKGGEEQVAHPDRILFRPTRGKKKARLEEALEDSTGSDVCAATTLRPTASSFGVDAVEEGEEVAEEEEERQHELGRTSEVDLSRASGPVFRRRAGPRASKAAMRHRCSLEGDDEEEEDAGTLGQQQTSKAVGSSPNEEADQNSDSSLGPEDSDILEEDAPEGI